MNNQERLELVLLKNRQQRLSQDLEDLAQRIRMLEARLQEEVSSPTIQAASTPPPLPPVIGFESELQTQPEEQIPVELSMAGEAPASPAANAPSAQTTEPFDSAWTEAESVSVPHRVQKESFEMRLGTYWFVRIGIVLLLTALAFLGNYAYQNFVFGMGPGGKVALLYGASGLMLGAGAWLQRKRGIANLRNYAQVLFAGGLAAVYFTTYAAHHIERLKVIQNPVLDGALLLAWAAFMVWLADRKKSELMALFALGLAYYTSTITRTGAFTLYSNLVLTAASVFFLWRNRWAAVSAISLPATYAGFAFWRFYAPTGWRFPDADEGLMFSAAFLGAYWIVFSAAVFISKHEQLRGGNRAIFLTFNNAAALGLFLLTMAQLQTGGLWKVCLGFGSVLLALAFLARRVLGDDPIVENAYLTQGLALVTAGFIAKFSGMDLALLLAVESVVLFALGCRLSNAIFRGGGWICGLLAVGWVMDALSGDKRSTMYTGMGVVLAMLVNTVLSHQRPREQRRFFEPEVGFFTLLLLVTLCSVIWTHVERVNLGSTLVVAALLLTFSVYLLRIREIPMFSQPLLVFAHVAWLGNMVARAGAPWDGWTQPVLLIGITLALLHWWQREQVMGFVREAKYGCQLICGFGIVSVLSTWILPHLHAKGLDNQYCATLAGLTVALVAYSTATRSGVLAIVSQFLLIPAGLIFLDGLLRSNVPWLWLLPLPLTFFLLAAGTNSWLRNEEVGEKAARMIHVTIAVYGWIGLGLLASLVATFVPERDCPWVYALLSLAPFAWAGFRKGELLAHSAALLICGFVAYGTPMKDEVWAHLPNLLLMAVILVEQRVARRFDYAIPEPVHRAAVIVGGLTLWLFLSRYVSFHVTGFLLTAAWSGLALALFMLGMLVRERSYRWLGLVVLAGALGRVVLMDVWKLHTIYRILSFMALGCVLLLLGYIYNRYQEKIREWL